MPSDFAGFEQAQTRLAEKLLSLHPPGFKRIEFRAELAPDNSTISFAYIYEDGHKEYEDWGWGNTRLCHDLQEAMRGPDGKMWKVMLMTIEMPRGHIKTEFEWEDSARWDPDPKYRQPGENW